MESSVGTFLNPLILSLLSMKKRARTNEAFIFTGNYFRRLPDGRKACSFCTLLWGKGTGNATLTTHLRRKHPAEYAEYERLAPKRKKTEPTAPAPPALPPLTPFPFATTSTPSTSSNPNSPSALLNILAALSTFSTPPTAPPIPSAPSSAPSSSAPSSSASSQDQILTKTEQNEELLSKVAAAVAAASATTNPNTTQSIPPLIPPPPPPPTITNITESLKSSEEDLLLSLIRDNKLNMTADSKVGASPRDKKTTKTSDTLRKDSNNILVMLQRQQFNSVVDTLWKMRESTEILDQLEYSKGVELVGEHLKDYYLDLCEEISNTRDGDRLAALVKWYKIFTSAQCLDRILAETDFLEPNLTEINSKLFIDINTLLISQKRKFSSRISHFEFQEAVALLENWRESSREVYDSKIKENFTRYELEMETQFVHTLDTLVKTAGKMIYEDDLSTLNVILENLTKASGLWTILRLSSDAAGERQGEPREVDFGHLKREVVNEINGVLQRLKDDFQSQLEDDKLQDAEVTYRRLRSSTAIKCEGVRTICKEDLDKMKETVDLMKGYALRPYGAPKNRDFHAQLIRIKTTDFKIFVSILETAQKQINDIENKLTGLISNFPRLPRAIVREFVELYYFRIAFKSFDPEDQAESVFLLAKERLHETYNDCLSRVHDAAAACKWREHMTLCHALREAHKVFQSPSSFGVPEREIKDLLPPDSKSQLDALETKTESYRDEVRQSLNYVSQVNIFASVDVKILAHHLDLIHRYADLLPEKSVTTVRELSGKIASLVVELPKRFEASNFDAIAHLVKTLSQLEDFHRLPDVYRLMIEAKNMVFPYISGKIDALCAELLNVNENSDLTTIQTNGKRMELMWKAFRGTEMGSTKVGLVVSSLKHYVSQRLKLEKKEGKKEESVIVREMSEFSKALELTELSMYVEKELKAFTPAHISL